MPTLEELPPDFDYTECFGVLKFCDKRVPECSQCRYVPACRYAAHSKSLQKDPNSRSGHVSYEQYAYSGDVADRFSPAGFDERNGTEEPIYTTNDLTQLLSFFLSVDDYSLAAMAQILRERTVTAADLGRFFGVSRQAAHQKLIRSCEKHPELNALIMGTLYRCKRVLSGRNASWSNNPARGTSKQITQARKAEAW